MRFVTCVTKLTRGMMIKGETENVSGVGLEAGLSLARIKLNLARRVVILGSVGAGIGARTLRSDAKGAPEQPRVADRRDLCLESAGLAVEDK